MGAKKGSKKATSTGSTGGSMGGSLEYTRGAKRRYAEKLRQEEERYNSLCGPVTVRRIGDPV